MPDLSPGDPIRVEMTKWVDRPHWAFPGVYLGADDLGDWIGFPAGTHMERPGMEFLSSNHQVGLVPGADLLTGGWLATLHGPGGSVHTYVDMCTRPVWDGATVRAVDLDLDVVQRLDGSVYVDDEDEFAAHRVELGYPDEVSALAQASRDAVLAAVTARTRPFDAPHAGAWFAVLAGVLAETPAGTPADPAG